MRISRTATTTVAVLAGAALAATAVAGPADAAKKSRGFSTTAAVGLTNDGRLVTFDLRKPKQASKAVALSGLSGDTALIGIDYRIQDQALYGVGNAGGVYVLVPKRGVASKVSQLSVPLAGTAFGVDFNPAADRLRVVSNTGQNLRHNVNPGGTTIVDGALSYPAPPAPATTAMGITAAAYTNNDNDANTATTLFDLDAAQDQVAVQSPANAGSLAATGKLLQAAEGDVGFDITAHRKSNRAVSNAGYATMTIGGRARLYAVDLTSGLATSIGTFPASRQVLDLAIRVSK